MDEDQLGLVEKADIDESMAVYQKNGDQQSKSLSELNVAEKYNRMSRSPDFAFVQNYRSADGINLRNYVLLDSESTVNAFYNKNFVEIV